MREKMRLCVKELPAFGWEWKGSVPLGLLADGSVGDIAPLEGLRSDLTLFARVERCADVYEVHVSWQVSAMKSCRRCLADFEQVFKGETQRSFRSVALEKSDDVLSADGYIDLLDVVRESVWQEILPDALCKPDCKGLCPNCGADLNHGACTCRTEDDNHPFAALKNLKLDS